jgi:hypothetical protein
MKNCDLIWCYPVLVTVTVMVLLNVFMLKSMLEETGKVKVAVVIWLGVSTALF